MINNITFSGHLGRDAEVRHTPKGDAVCSFAVPCTSGWGDKKKTVWVECSMWRERGEKLAPYLTKGTPVVVSGEFSMSEPYTDKKGETRVNARCNVNQIQLGKSSDAQPMDKAPVAKPPVAKPAEPFDNFYDDSIPF